MIQKTKFIKNVDSTFNYNEYKILIANASNEFYTKEIKEAKIEDGGSGAFYINLRKLK